MSPLPAGRPADPPAERDDRRPNRLCPSLRFHNQNAAGRCLESPPHDDHPITTRFSPERAIGFEETVLDILPSMVEAQQMYQRLGFEAHSP